MPEHTAERPHNTEADLEITRLEDRVRHLQSQVNLQRALLGQAVDQGESACATKLRAMVRVLEELEERNIVLEEALKRAEIWIESRIGTRPWKGGGKDLLGPAHVRDIRLEAEMLRDKGEYKEARRLIREARQRKVLAGSGLQLLACSRFSAVRLMFSFYRYK